jgi:threonine/homoserine/homoserine lactone efflux protein
MDFFFSFSGILFALIIGVVSPGPSFLFIAQRSVSISRSDGISAALGMGVGGVIFAVLGLLGLHAMLVTVPWVYAILKMFGGLYLFFLAFKIWRGSSQSLHFQEVKKKSEKAWRSSFLLGLTTQLSNPKTAIVYGSIFAAMLPHHISFTYNVLILPFVFMIEAGWYIIVAVALSSTAPRKAYTKSKLWIDRVAAGVMGLLGLKLITSTTTAL